jgi:hypothetical protein
MTRERMIVQPSHGLLWVEADPDAPYPDSMERRTFSSTDGTLYIAGQAPVDGETLLIVSTGDLGPEPGLDTSSPDYECRLSAPTREVRIGGEPGSWYAIIAVESSVVNVRVFLDAPENPSVVGIEIRSGVE